MRTIIVILILLFSWTGITVAQVDSVQSINRISAGNLDTLRSDLQHFSSLLEQINERTQRIEHDDQQQWSLWDIFMAIVTGIIASIMVLTYQWQKHRRELKKLFKPLEGKYDHLDIETEKKYPGKRTIITYKGGNVLLTRGTSEDPIKGSWSGRIVMDKNMPDYGSGFFQYDPGPQGNQSGLHTVFIDREKDRIHVGINTITPILRAGLG